MRSSLPPSFSSLLRSFCPSNTPEKEKAGCLVRVRPSCLASPLTGPEDNHRDRGLQRWRVPLARTNRRGSINMRYYSSQYQKGVLWLLACGWGMVEDVMQNRWSVLARLLGCMLVHLDHINEQHHRSDVSFIPSLLLLFPLSSCATGRRASACPIFSRIDWSPTLPALSIKPSWPAVPVASP